MGCASKLVGGGGTPGALNSRAYARDVECHARSATYTIEGEVFEG